MAILVKIRKIDEIKHMPWIKIAKHSEKNNIVYYEVYKNDCEIIECYMGLDKDMLLILYYFTTNFDHESPFKIVDLKNLDTPIDPLYGITRLVFLRSMVAGVRAIKNNTFPNGWIIAPVNNLSFHASKIWKTSLDLQF